jgi:hypothetical protein
LYLFRPADRSFPFYLSTVSETISCITFARILVCLLAYVFIRNVKHKKEYCSLILYAIIDVTLVWQLAMVFNSQICVNFDGYTYWIPVVKYAMQSLQHFIV